MKLNAWLRQEHSFPERLQVVERLAQTLNEIHDRGESLAALDPEHVDVGGDGQCDVSGARRGNPSTAYSAPERTEGGPPSAEADIYAAGAIAWEVLSGRPCGTSPTHLAEASPTVPRELADAVMACLEQSPQWRPRDLTYLAQLAQHAQGQRPKAERSPRAAGSFSRGASARAGSASVSAPLRTTMRRESRSHLPLAIAAGLVVAAAAGSYYWLTRERGEQPDRRAAPTSTSLSVAAQPVATPPLAGSAAASPAPTPRPVMTASAAPVALPNVATPLPTTPLPSARPAATPTPSASAPLPAGTLAASRPNPDPLPRTMATPMPPPITTLPATTTTTNAPAPPPNLVREPVILTALSPLSARRPGKVVFDLRGSGLRPDLRVRVLALKEVPRGITVVRQVCKGPGLFQALVDLDSSVVPGNYALVLEEATGSLSRSLTFTVTK